MKNKSTLNSILTLIGLIAATLGAYTIARFFLNNQKALSEPIPIFSTIYSTATPIPIPDAKPKLVARLSGRIHAFDVSPDLQTIAIATSNGILLFDLETYKPIRILDDKENSFSVGWSRDGTKLATGSLIMRNSELGKGHLVVWDTSKWKILFEPKMGAGETMFFGALAWSPDGNLLATSDYDRGLVSYNVKTGQIISLQKDFLVSSYDISWSPNGSRVIATGDLGFGFRRWRIDTDQAVRVYDPRAGAAAFRLAWSPNGDRIASVHGDGMVCFWTVTTNHCDGLIKAHPSNAFSLAWSPDGNQLATGGGVIRIWDTRTGEQTSSFGLSDHSIYTDLEWLPNGTLVSLETGIGEHQLTVIRFWDVKKGSISLEFQGASGMLGE